ncbi:MAG: hypothetical protein ACLQGV_13090 [Bryobacteraceae bacterium]
MAFEAADEVFFGLIVTVDALEAVNLRKKPFDVIRAEEISAVGALVDNLRQEDRKAVRSIGQESSKKPDQRCVS